MPIAGVCSVSHGVVYLCRMRLLRSLSADRQARKDGLVGEGGGTNPSVPSVCFTPLADEHPAPQS
jgi:hypothetical protein